jgi:hypothetical protein
MATKFRDFPQSIQAAAKHDSSFTTLCGVINIKERLILFQKIRPLGHKYKANWTYVQYRFAVQKNSMYQNLLINCLQGMVHHNMKMYVGMETRFHVFLTLALQV